MSRPVSAGILLYRIRDGHLEVLLAHPGGPYFARRDVGHWTIPKGEVTPGDALFDTAAREFEEETGHSLARVATEVAHEPISIGTVTQASGKIVHCWAVEGTLDPAMASSNTFQMHWPAGSTELQTFPEVDRVEWFSLAEARRRANRSQAAFVDRLRETLASATA